MAPCTRCWVVLIILRKILYTILNGRIWIFAHFWLCKFIWCVSREKCQNYCLHNSHKPLFRFTNTINLQIRPPRYANSISWFSVPLSNGSLLPLFGWYQIILLMTSARVWTICPVITCYMGNCFTLEQEVKVIWQKVPIPRLGVTPGGRKLYHWIPGVGFPISVP